MTEKKYQFLDIIFSMYGQYPAPNVVMLCDGHILEFESLY